jgi:hypothetical protein
VSDLGILEADKDFTPDVFDDTYLNMELAVRRDSDGPKFASNQAFEGQGQIANRQSEQQSNLGHKNVRSRVPQRAQSITRS